MKNFNKTVFTISLVFIVCLSNSLAQDDKDDVHNVIITLPEVALLDLEAASGTSISLGPDAPNEAGQALDFSAESNSDIWVNYSSIIGRKTEPSRNITVQITSGKIPAGLQLSVVANADAGMGDGRMGKPTSAVTLSEKAQDIIEGVGSAYTGNGVSKGHQLTYTLALSKEEGSYAKLDFDNSNSLGITYTLTDQ
ncbi:MAG: hypothetical protein HKN87_06440 [Saprospiraceae bacterium]|nr:hypothetical protein [Saprospiraceae bacterium]